MKKDKEETFHSKYFILIEILNFYAQVFTMIVWLVYIQIRGFCGGKNYMANKNRYKYDALEYYKDDVQWLSFSIVPMFYKLVNFLDITQMYGSDPTRNEMLWYFMVANVVRTILLMPLRTQNRQLKRRGVKTWAVIYGMFVVGWIYRCFMSE